MGLKDSGLNEQLSLAALKMLVRRYRTRMEPPDSHRTLDSSLFYEKKEGNTHTHTHLSGRGRDLLTLDFRLEGFVAEEGDTRTKTELT